MAGRGVGPHRVDDHGERVPAPHQGLHQGKRRGAVSCLFGVLFFFLSCFCSFGLFVCSTVCFTRVFFFFCCVRKSVLFLSCVCVDCFFVLFRSEQSGMVGDSWMDGGVACGSEVDAYRLSLWENRAAEELER